MAPDDGTDFTILYNAADKALYYVKQNGKNSYHFFSDRLHSESRRDAKMVDLNYLHDFMSRGDNGKGAYLLDFDSFRHVYNFTISEADAQFLDVSETELALELLEQAIHTSLRRSDVPTRYSSKQLIVILMGANHENSEMVAERILHASGSFIKGTKSA